MKFDLSIIIAHFKPINSEQINPLIKTLRIIEKQKSNYNFEIIIADDGSLYTKEIKENYSAKINLLNDDRSIYFSKKKKLESLLKNIKIKSDLITNWVYLPKTKKCMSKARVINQAVKISKSENLFFIDDDNYFISSDSIMEINNLFNKYQFIVGQIKDNNGRLRRYESKRVQGSTIGIKKNIFNKINGFGEWTEKFSCGVDSDFWIKTYNYFITKNNLNACFTNKISTHDSFSKRWKIYTSFFQDFKLKKEFYKLHKCKNYKSSRYNNSRNKKLWINNLIND